MSITSDPFIVGSGINFINNEIAEMEPENETDAKLDPPKEFNAVMRGIAGTPKSEVDKAEEVERQKKDANGQK